MPILPVALDGNELGVYDRTVPFSFWPTEQTKPRRTVQSLLFVKDPWVVMRRSVSKQVGEEDSRHEAHSYIDQARDFYESAQTSAIDGAKPVQLYYSYLNLVKAFIICRKTQKSLPSIMHGMNERVHSPGEEFSDAYIKFWSSPNDRDQLQVLDEFLHALKVPRLKNGKTINIPHLLPQILPGHRLWAAAKNESERFISIQSIKFFHHQSRREVWLRIYLFKDDIKRLNYTNQRSYTQKKILQHSGLDDDFRNVRCDLNVDNRPLVCFEQRNPIQFGRHGVDCASELAAKLKNRIWITAGSAAPFRRYYLYLCPPDERGNIIPQLASIYSLTYYFGSITRYRPNVFRTVLEGPFGPRVSEFISGQPSQFVYLIASEFAERDITKPSLV